MKLYGVNTTGAIASSHHGRWCRLRRVLGATFVAVAPAAGSCASSKFTWCCWSGDSPNGEQQPDSCTATAGTER